MSRSNGPRPSLRDVAQLAGVAVSSASRVLSGHPNVSPDMRQRVVGAAAQLGYEPDFLAQSLRRGDTFTVGLVIRDISNSLVAEIVLGAEGALRARGYYLLMLNSESNPALVAEHIRLLERRRVDGALISVADESDPDTLSALRALSVPSVLIDRELPVPSVESSAVLIDYEHDMRAVVDHLATLGHRTIGLVLGSPVMRPGREAVRVFIRTCAERSIDALVEAGSFSVEHGFNATTKMLCDTVTPTAIIAHSSQIFPGVLRAIREQGLNVPQDISLVSADDMPLLDLLSPPIDAVQRAGREVGRVASELLLHRFAGNDPQTVLIPSTFVLRGSSGPPRLDARR